MNTSRENISLWLEQSDPDYYLFFLKTWLPFNAWYVAEYPALKKRDRDIIKQLQDDDQSKPRKIIENFLSNSANHDALRFQSFLAELHFNLEKTPFTHNGNRLSFTNLSLTENPLKHKSYVDSKGNVYKTEKTSSYFQAYIEAKGGKVLLDFKKPTFEIDDLSKDTNFIRLDPKVQDKILSFFEEINPKKPVTLVCKSRSKKDFIQLKSLNTCKFINDRKTVAKGCIAVLYALRCMLFHGEVAPTKTNKEAYKNAFYILQLIIKEFK